MKQTLILKAELCVVGGLMLDNSKYDQICDIVKPIYFIDKKAKLIFQAIQVLHDRNQPFDAILVGDFLKLDDAKTDTAIAECVKIAMDTPGTSNCVEYANCVRTNYIQRKHIALMVQFSDRFGGDQQIPVVAAELQKKLIELDTLRAKGPTTFKALQEDFLQNLGKNVAGLKTGFDEFDRLSGGLMPGQFVIIAGRPGMGKSALLLNILANMCRKKKIVSWFSLEMTPESNMFRLLMREGNIGSEKIPDKRFRNELTTIMKDISEFQLFIDDTNEHWLDNIRSETRKLKQRDGLDLMAVDYLQLVECTEENRFQKVSEVSRQLKALAMELNIVIIAVAQLNRDPEKRRDQRPVLSDLRESGQIEQDADIVTFVYRDELCCKRSNNPGIAEWIVRKNRDGELGTSYLTAELWKMQFKEFQGEIVPEPEFEIL